MASATCAGFLVPGLAVSSSPDRRFPYIGISKWLLIPPTENEVKLIFEVIHKRRKKSSTNFCSQFQDDGWYERLGGGDNPISDAIMDRIQYDAYRINIVPSDPTNDRSMREVYGIKSISDGK